MHKLHSIFVHVFFFCFGKKVAILGASGYTGAELIRLLSGHPRVQINTLSSDRSAGLNYKNVFPQFSYRNDLPELCKWENAQTEIESCDVVFCCLPHGTTQEIISSISKATHLKVEGSTYVVMF